MQVDAEHLAEAIRGIAGDGAGGHHLHRLDAQADPAAVCPQIQELRRDERICGGDDWRTKGYKGFLP